VTACLSARLGEAKAEIEGEGGEARRRRAGRTEGGRTGQSLAANRTEATIGRGGSIYPRSGASGELRVAGGGAGREERGSPRLEVEESEKAVIVGVMPDGGRGGPESGELG
jgi:hypothetical protein